MLGNFSNPMVLEVEHCVIGPSVVSTGSTLKETAYSQDMNIVAGHWRRAVALCVSGPNLDLFITFTSAIAHGNV